MMAPVTPCARVPAALRRACFEDRSLYETGENACRHTDAVTAAALVRSSGNQSEERVFPASHPALFG